MYKTAGNELFELTNTNNAVSNVLIYINCSYNVFMYWERDCLLVVSHGCSRCCLNRVILILRVIMLMMF